MILYLDTSALVKRYFQEPYSDEIISKWRSATQIVTSFVAYAETMAAIYRKKREADLTNALIRKITDQLHYDWESFIRVEVNGELDGYIRRAVEAHPLRGFDAIHLASAIVVRERLDEDFVFACFDERLARAARLEGLEAFPSAPQDEGR
ncbi:MAG: PIN domain-containing protein [Desulfobacteraceae bacterium]|nr:MAG: PIN domain-containing protein [Desulfobacteraceae bacterium]